MDNNVKNEADGTDLVAYCSWCNNLTVHNWCGKTRQFRKIYTCDFCSNETVLCRAKNCENMSKAGLAFQDELKLGFLKSVWEKVDNFYCSEHRHEVIGFKKGGYEVKFLNEVDCSKFEYEKNNYQKYTSIGVGVIGGALVMGPVYYLGAPAIAAWFGSQGFLGAASTGTQISTLSGAALESASLAKMGFGALSINGLGMTGGTVIIGGVGGTLGGVSGANVAADYYKTIEDFEYVKLAEKGEKEVIFINGLFSQNDSLFKGWKNELEGYYKNATLTGLRWESNALSNLAGVDLDDLSKMLKKTPNRIGMLMTRLTKVKSLTNVLGFFGLVNNIWFVTYYRAAVTGYILADNIARLQKGSKIDLFGHSLGARVIFYALQVLSTKDEVFIENVYLFGGAQERKDISGWANASKSVSGKIYNVYSSNDKVLKILYQAGTLGSSPIGLKPITLETDDIVNLDASEWIDGHSDYHQNFKLLIEKIRNMEEETSEFHSSNSNSMTIIVTILLFFLVLISVYILIFNK